MPKYYETVKITAVGGEEVVEKALISTAVEKKRAVALYPDDSLDTSELRAYIEREHQVKFHLDNLVGEASKRVVVDMEIPVGQIFYVGYKFAAGITGDKFIVIEYELVP